MGFNASSNKYTDQLMSMMGSLAMEEMQLERKKTQAAEILKNLQSGGLFGGGTPGAKPNTAQPNMPGAVPMAGGNGLFGDAYVSGVDLETGMPKISIMSPKEKAEMGLMEDIKNDPGFRRKSVSAGGQTFERVPTPEEKEIEVQDEAYKKAIVKSEEEKVTNATKVGRLSNLVDLVEKKFAETKTPQGVGGFIKRPVENLLMGAQLTENQRTDKAYVNFVEGLKAQLARAMGEVGNLSETEQKSAIRLIPNTWDDPRTAAKKIQTLREFVTQIQDAARKPNTFIRAKGSAGEPAAAKAEAPGAQLFKDGQTATNPKTGKKIVWRDGKWISF